MNRLNLSFGAEVHVRSKRLGTLQKVVVNPRATYATHILVQKGILFKQFIVFPLDVVESAQPDKITLRLNHDEIKNYPIFEEYIVNVGVSQPDMQLEGTRDIRLHPYPLDHIPDVASDLYVEKQIVREGVDSENFIWDAHTTLHTFQGYLGDLAQVIIASEDGRLLQLVMRHGKSARQFRAVPTEFIEQNSEVEIHLAIDNQDLDELVVYYYNGTSGIEMEDDSGEPLEGGQGKPLTSHLLNDLTSKLAEDPRTETAVIELICEGGVVTLEGTVADQGTKEVAANLVSNHPEVITVHNNLKLKAK